MAAQTRPQAEGRLTTAEVKDEADSARRAPEPDLSGKRLRAIPARGGTTVKVRRRDFSDHGIDHPDVEFDFRKDDFTVAVGEDGGISSEAADFLSKNYPTSFEYLDQGKSDK